MEHTPISDEGLDHAIMVETVRCNVDVTRALVELRERRAEISMAVDLARSFIAGGDSSAIRSDTTTKIARALIALYDRGVR